ncbi:ABC transporter substrate-binding protein [Nonomuraea sp. NBC_01738]|uniref:ABC transporter substrate-binding protein n=1 Tax=Nonomuraea sp. NBC_01738 TaxID=2976003 RepID=UPI002E137F42|nr:ABC transporter substrate-binding protein [Nonomuraea sp. NBC_01738]
MSTSPTPIRIGALAPLTPPGWVHAGRHLIAGLQRAITDVNTTGGIGGRPLDLLIRDTAADPAKAEAAVDELAHLGIAALAGEYHSVVARTAAARADTLGLPYLCTSAVLDTLTQHPTDRVARLSPPQSRGWRTYADHLLATGHTRIAVATQPSVYWAAGTRILTDHLTPHGATVLELDAATLTPAALCDELAGNGADTLLLLTGFPEPAVPIVTAVRRDPRLTGLQLGAPAGQPEFTAWTELLGADGTGVPFLRYLPDQLTPLGTRVETTLRQQLGQDPSFVAFEGYDTGLVLAELLRTGGTDWGSVTADGTRGRIQFTRTPGITVWQWAEPPIQVVDRDPADPSRYRVLRTG